MRSGDKVRRFALEQQQIVLAFIERVEAKSIGFDFDTWQAHVDAIHGQIQTEHDNDYTIDAQRLLDNVRDEAS